MKDPKVNSEGRLLKTFLSSRFFFLRLLGVAGREAGDGGVTKDE